jgi:hypothetical protein
MTNSGKRILDNRIEHTVYRWILCRSSMAAGLVFAKYIEPPLHFRPTYKFDLNSDTYDSGPKQRIPSWTDRLLYIPTSGLTCLAYNSDESVRTSDHRPVYASFLVPINTYVQLDGRQEALLPSKTSQHVFTSESQVCAIS